MPTSPRPPRFPGARALHAVLAAALLFAAGGARAEVGPLRVDLRTDLAVTAGAAAGALAFAIAKPGRCQWCASDGLDLDARARLRWSDPGAASDVSDVLVSGVLPAAVLANSYLSARAGGAPEAFWEDALVIAEAAAITALVNGAAKDGFARRRPNAGPTATGSSNAAFFSGHTSQAFSLAAAAGTVSTLRGYPSAPWVWAGGLTLAAATGYLRVAGDKHWATDVLTGAAVGGVIGWAVPWFFHRVNRPGGALAIAPAPGGVAVVF